MAFAAIVAGAGLLMLASPVEVIVRVYDYARLKPRVRAEMETEMGRILGDAGIGVRFRDCRGDMTAACLDLARAGTVELRIVKQVDRPKSPAARKKRGFAAMTKEGGTMITVLAGKVACEPDGLRIPEGVLLGHIAAHEIGHLLLGEDSHSAHGIMEGCWGPGELEKINKGALLFSDEEAERMRAEVGGN
jgi:hypothetical protein